MNFQVGDITIFPGRGVGKVISIDDIERIEGDTPVEFRVYRIRFPADPLSSTGLESILEIPFQKNGENLPLSNNSMRQVIGEEQIQSKIYEPLRIIDEPATDTWNRRYRTYQQKIGSGDCSEIASILRELATLRDQKELSFGERKMYDQAIELLMDEVAYAKLHDALQENVDYIEQKEKCETTKSTKDKKLSQITQQLSDLETNWKAKVIPTKQYRPEKKEIEEKYEQDRLYWDKEVEKNNHRLLEIESQIIDVLRQSVKQNIEEIFEETKPLLETDSKKKKKSPVKVESLDNEDSESSSENRSE